jgi:hypothetical protein
MSDKKSVINYPYAHTECVKSYLNMNTEEKDLTEYLLYCNKLCVVLGVLVVAFAGSNPAEDVARLPSEGRSHVADLQHVKESYEHEKMLCRQNSAAMFLTHVSPASLLDGFSRRIRIE